MSEVLKYLEKENEKRRNKYMRDVIFIPISETKDIVIAADNVGGVGLKTHDDVTVSYDVIAYFSLRVALTECLAAGAEPFAIVIQNFVDKDVWSDYEKGAQKVLRELNREPLPIVGSSESNFSLLQSAVGFTVLGNGLRSNRKTNKTPQDAKIAVIGQPLVGDEVLLHGKHVAPLHLFQQLIVHDDVYEVVPVGSKGIAYEIREIFKSNAFDNRSFDCLLNLEKSAGPATCLIITYNQAAEEDIQQMSGDYFYPVTMN